MLAGPPISSLDIPHSARFVQVAPPSSHSKPTSVTPLHTSLWESTEHVPCAPSANEREQNGPGASYGGGVFAKTGGYLVDGRPRKLHPRECARLMGYPDSYIISDKSSHAYQQFGNSVVVDVIQYIGIEIGKAII